MIYQPPFQSQIVYGIFATLSFQGIVTAAYHGIKVKKSIFFRLARFILRSGSF